MNGRLSRLFAYALFRMAIPRRPWRLPELPGAEQFTARSVDGVALAGWLVRNARRRGTVLIIHGLTRDCTSDGIPAWGERFTARGFAVAAIDLRGHGRSQPAVPGFGSIEAADVRAGIDACVAAGLPQPFTVIGGSLGALAGQCAAIEDARIAALVLLAMPASPTHGLMVGAQAVVALARPELRAHVGVALASVICLGLSAFARGAGAIGRLLDRAHGFPALRSADVLRRRIPAQRPLVLSIIGAADPYDWRATARAWRRWASADAKPFKRPAEAPHQAAWFVLAPGLGHPPMSPHLLEWAGLGPLLDQFLELVAVRHQRQAPEAEAGNSRLMLDHPAN
ncbi:MAG: alpha/beta fold hydrolase [Planctomycetes bacterium]|nr:alpha/beta fold hydrolase [Planctomycetota bacterium]